MSKIQKDQLDYASKFMTAFWTEIVKPNYNPEKTDAWWDRYLDNMCEFAKKYCKGDKRLEKMVVGFTNGINEVYRDAYGRR